MLVRAAHGEQLRQRGTFDPDQDAAGIRVADLDAHGYQRLGAEISQVQLVAEQVSAIDRYGPRRGRDLQVERLRQHHPGCRGRGDGEAKK